MPIKNYAYAARDSSGFLSPFEYEIRDPRDDEIVVKVLYCGICHSDLHFAKAEWGPPPYPVVTGHEFIAEVIKTGEKATKYKVGDRIGVGCMVDSCKSCGECGKGFEQYCPQMKQTYGSVNYDQPTYGGYGKYVILNEHFGIPLPANLRIEDAAPLLCAGITTYTPMKDANVSKGNMTIAVVGLGGLGHMAVQFAKKMNPTNDVWVISRSRAKEELAKKLGATGIIPVDELSEHQNKFDFMLNTMSSGGEDFNKHMGVMKPHGIITVVGAIQIPPLETIPFLMKNLTLRSSIIGGVPGHKEMLEFCAQNDVYPMVEHIKMEQVNEAWERVLKSDVRFRFIIDVNDSYAS